jgi:predicted exporter/predicted hotdog family 3-hydroxylacyl-ACP dehydratase
LKRTPLALLLFAVWIVALAILGWFVQRQLVVGADLRLFLPSPTTPEQRLLLEEVGEGPASRVLAIALEGAPPEQLADISRGLVARLQDSREFRLVTNGEFTLDSVPDELLPYRFLLSPTLDTQRFDAPYLHAELLARARDLASPAGSFLEPWLPRDPTLEMLKLLQRWQPMQEPRREYDVWFDRSGRRALLVAETRAAAFDPDRQREALDGLQGALASAASGTPVKMTVSGAGKFSVMMEARTRGQAQALGTAATVGMILLLLIAYRRIGSIVLSILPLASAGLAGLAVVSALFGTVHGITLAFGFTLIGVAQDYPLHLLSHRRPDHDPVQIARHLWPTLATGVASTCIAYFTFLFSGVIGLAQLACFTVAALAVAGLTTRFALPPLMDRTAQDFGASPFLDRLWQRIEMLPRMRWIGVLIAIVALAVIALAPQRFWENDLARLTPVPEDLLMQDQRLRGELGTPDVRYLLVVDAADSDGALTQLEALDPALQALVARHAIGGYDHAARYVPSAATQLRRRHRLPDTASLRSALQVALADTPFRPDVFEPFAQDVARARRLRPLTIETMRSTALGASMDMLISQRRENPAQGCANAAGAGCAGAATNALVTFSGVQDVAALRALATAAGSNVRLLDTKGESETLVAAQRTRMLWTLAVAAALLVGVITFALRSRSRILRVLAPMALTTLIVLAALRGSGVSLNLFHLIALILAAGLGLDYALFFEHASADRAEQRRTLHAVLVCSFSTLMVFALLMISDVPVLRAIGVTVTLGVICNFVLALLLTRPEMGTFLISSATPALPMAPGEMRNVPISALIPQQGAMCLLERIVDWDERRVVLETDSHRSLSNPLRVADKLRAIHLCEYGAQAMAVHGALRTGARTAGDGMLVAMRSVTFTRDWIHDLPASLRVEAECLQHDAASLQYSFRITHHDEKLGDQLLAEGRAAVMLQAARTA